MADREKVIKGLECCVKTIEDCECTDNCPYESQCWDGTMYLGMMLDALELLKAQEPGWISVKDRMPEEYGNYLAVVDGEVTECTYSRPFIKGIINGWSLCNANGFKWLRDEHVTCWMPLPEPQKEET